MATNNEAKEPSLNEMKEKGVIFSIHHPGPSGAIHMDLPMEHVTKYCADPEGYIAACYGITRAEYLEWHSSEYCVQCSGRRKDGKQCKGIVLGGHSVATPDKWVKLHGGYCHTHKEGN